MTPSVTKIIAFFLPYCGWLTIEKYQPAEFRRLSVRDIIAFRRLLSAFGLFGQPC